MMNTIRRFEKVAKERLSIKALEEWEGGKATSGLDTEGLPLLELLNKKEAT